MTTEEKIKKDLERRRNELTDKAVAKVRMRMKLLHDFCLCADILITDIDQALTFTDEYGRPLRLPFDHEKKKDFKNFLDAIRRADVLYEKVYKDLGDAAGGDWHREELFRKDANELIRFVMLYIDRAETLEKVRMIEEFISGMPECGIFPREIIERYNFGKF